MEICAEFGPEAELETDVCTDLTDTDFTETASERATGSDRSDLIF